MDSAKELEKEMADLEEELYAITHLHYNAFVGMSEHYYLAHKRLVNRLENNISDLKKEHELLKQKGLI